MKSLRNIVVYILVACMCAALLYIPGLENVYAESEGGAGITTDGGTNSGITTDGGTNGGITTDGGTNGGITTDGGTTNGGTTNGGTTAEGGTTTDGGTTNGGTTNGGTTTDGGTTNGGTTNGGGIMLMSVAANGGDDTTVAAITTGSITFENANNGSLQFYTIIDRSTLPTDMQGFTKRVILTNPSSPIDLDKDLIDNIHNGSIQGIPYDDGNPRSSWNGVGSGDPPGLFNILVVLTDNDNNPLGYYSATFNITGGWPGAGRMDVPAVSADAVTFENYTSGKGFNTVINRGSLPSAISSFTKISVMASTNSFNVQQNGLPSQINGINDYHNPCYSTDVPNVGTYNVLVILADNANNPLGYLETVFTVTGSPQVPVIPDGSITFQNLNNGTLDFYTIINRDSLPDGIKNFTKFVVYTNPSWPITASPSMLYDIKHGGFTRTYVDDNPSLTCNGPGSPVPGVYHMMVILTDDSNNALGYFSTTYNITSGAITTAPVITDGITFEVSSTSALHFSTNVDRNLLPASMAAFIKMTVYTSNIDYNIQQTGLAQYNQGLMDCNTADRFAVFNSSASTPDYHHILVVLFDAQLVPLGYLVTTLNLTSSTTEIIGIDIPNQPPVETPHTTGSDVNYSADGVAITVHTQGITEALVRSGFIELKGMYHSIPADMQNAVLHTDGTVTYTFDGVPADKYAAVAGFGPAKEKSAEFNVGPYNNEAIVYDYNFMWGFPAGMKDGFGIGLQGLNLDKLSKPGFKFELVDINNSQNVVANNLDKDNNIMTPGTWGDFTNMWVPINICDQTNGLPEGEYILRVTAPEGNNDWHTEVGVRMGGNHFFGFNQNQPFVKFDINPNLAAVNQTGLVLNIPAGNFKNVNASSVSVELSEDYQGGWSAAASTVAINPNQHGDKYMWDSFITATFNTTLPAYPTSMKVTIKINGTAVPCSDRLMRADITDKSFITLNNPPEQIDEPCTSSGAFGVSFDVNASVYNVANQILNGPDQNIWVWLEGRDGTKARYDAILSASGGSINAHFAGIMPGYYYMLARVKYLDHDYQIQNQFTVESFEQRPVITGINRRIFRAGDNSAEFDVQGMHLDQLYGPKNSQTVIRLTDGSGNVVADSVQRNGDKWPGFDVGKGSASFRLRSEMPIQAGTYTIDAVNDVSTGSEYGWIPDYSNHAGQIEFTSDTFLWGDRYPWVMKANSPGDLSIRMANLPADKTGYSMKLEEFNKDGTIKRSWLASGADVSIDQDKQNDNSWGWITAHFNGSMPEYDTSVKVTVYNASSSALRCTYGDIWEDITTRPRTYSINPRDVDPGQNEYHFTLKGWNLNQASPFSIELHRWSDNGDVRVDGDLTYTKDDENINITFSPAGMMVPGKYWFKIQVEPGVESDQEFNVNSQPNFGINIDSIDNVSGPGGDVQLAETQPENASGAGHSFDVTLKVRGLIGGLENLGKWAGLDGRDGTNGRIMASSYTLDSADQKITAHFEHVQPGIYKLWAAAGMNDMWGDSGIDKVTVASFDGNAVVTQLENSNWAVPKGADRFWIRYYGYNLTSLIKSIDGRDKVEAELVDPHNNDNVVAKTVVDNENLNFNYDGNGTTINMEFKCVVSGGMQLNETGYMLKIIPPAGVQLSGMRAHNISVIDKAFIYWVNPDKYSATLKGDTMYIGGSNLARLNGSDIKVVVKTFDNNIVASTTNTVLEYDPNDSLSNGRIKAVFSAVVAPNNNDYKVEVLFKGSGEPESAYHPLGGSEMLQNINVVDYPHLRGWNVYDINLPYLASDRYDFTINGVNLDTSKTYTIRIYGENTKKAKVNGKYLWEQLAEFQKVPSSSTHIDCTGVELGYDTTRSDMYYDIRVSDENGNELPGNQQMWIRIPDIGINIAEPIAIPPETFENGVYNASFDVYVELTNVDISALTLSGNIDNRNVWVRIDGRDGTNGSYQAVLSRVEGSNRIKATFNGIHPGWYELFTDVKYNGKNPGSKIDRILVDSWESRPLITARYCTLFRAGDDRLEFDVNGLHLDALNGTVGHPTVFRLMNGSQVIAATQSPNDGWPGFDVNNDGKSMKIKLKSDGPIPQGEYTLEAYNDSWTTASAPWVTDYSNRTGKIKVTGDTFVTDERHPPVFKNGMDEFDLSIRIANLPGSLSGYSVSLVEYDNDGQVKDTWNTTNLNLKHDDPNNNNWGYLNAAFSGKALPDYDYDTKLKIVVTGPQGIVPVNSLNGESWVGVTPYRILYDVVSKQVAGGVSGGIFSFKGWNLYNIRPGLNYRFELWEETYDNNNKTRSKIADTSTPGSGLTYTVDGGEGERLTLTYAHPLIIGASYNVVAYYAEDNNDWRDDFWFDAVKPGIDKVYFTTDLVEENDGQGADLTLRAEFIGIDPAAITPANVTVMLQLPGGAHIAPSGPVSIVNGGIEASFTNIRASSGYAYAVKLNGIDCKTDWFTVDSIATVPAISYCNMQAIPAGCDKFWLSFSGLRMNQLNNNDYIFKLVNAANTSLVYAASRDGNNPTEFKADGNGGWMDVEFRSPSGMPGGKNVTLVVENASGGAIANVSILMDPIPVTGDILVNDAWPGKIAADSQVPDIWVRFTSDVPAGTDLWLELVQNLNREGSTEWSSVSTVTAKEEGNLYRFSGFGNAPSGGSTLYFIVHRKVNGVPSADVMNFNKKWIEVWSDPFIRGIEQNNYIPAESYHFELLGGNLNASKISEVELSMPHDNVYNHNTDWITVTGSALTVSSNSISFDLGNIKHGNYVVVVKDSNGNWLQDMQSFNIGYNDNNTQITGIEVLPAAPQETDHIIDGKTVYFVDDLKIKINANNFDPGNFNAKMKISTSGREYWTDTYSSGDKFTAAAGAITVDLDDMNIGAGLYTVEAWVNGKGYWKQDGAFTVRSVNDKPVIWSTWNNVLPNRMDRFWIGFDGFKLNELTGITDGQAIVARLVSASDPNMVVAVSNPEGETLNHDYGQDGSYLNLEFKTTSNDPIQAGDYKVIIENSGWDQSTGMRMNNIFITDQMYLDGNIRPNGVASGDRDFKFKLRANNIPHDVSGLEVKLVLGKWEDPNAQIWSTTDVSVAFDNPGDPNNGWGWIVAHFNLPQDTSMPAEDDRWLSLKVFKNGAELRMNNGINVNTHLYPSVYGMDEGYGRLYEGTVYSIQAKGWNFDDASGFSALLYEDNGNAIATSTITVTKIDDETLRIDFTTAANLIKDRKYYVRIYDSDTSPANGKNIGDAWFEVCPPKVDWNEVPWEVEADATGLASFTARIHTVGMNIPGLQISAGGYDVMAEGDLSAWPVVAWLTQMGRRVVPGGIHVDRDATDPFVISVTFRGVKPGKYNLFAQANFDGLTDNLLNGEEVRVKSQNGAPVISAVQQEVVPSGYDRLNLRFGGYGLDKLLDTYDYTLINSATGNPLAVHKTSDWTGGFWVSDDGTEAQIEFITQNQDGTQYGVGIANGKTFTLKVTNGVNTILSAENGNVLFSPVQAYNTAVIDWVRPRSIPQNIGINDIGMPLSITGPAFEGIPQGAVITVELVERNKLINPWKLTAGTVSRDGNTIVASNFSTTSGSKPDYDMTFDLKVTVEGVRMPMYNLQQVDMTRKASINWLDGVNAGGQQKIIAYGWNLGDGSKTYKGHLYGGGFNGEEYTASPTNGGTRLEFNVPALQYDKNYKFTIDDVNRYEDWVNLSNEPAIISVNQPEVGSIKSFKGKFVDIPVVINKISGIDAATVEILYDHTRLSYVSVTKGTNSGIGSVSGGIISDGVLRFTIITNNTLPDTLDLFTLKFEVIGENPSKSIFNAGNGVQMNTDLTLGVVYLENEGVPIQGYQKQNGSIRIGMRGDLSGDDKVTSFDGTLLLRAFNNSIQLTADQITAADVNGDGLVTGGDITNILKRAIETIAKLPIEN